MAEETQARSNMPLTAKVAGIPVWGVIAIAAAGGIVIMLWWRNKSGASSTGTGQTMTPVDTGIQGSDLASIISSLQGAQPGQAPSTSIESDRKQWLGKALAWWGKAGYKGSTPLHVQMALTDYLTDGKQLAPWEWWVVNTTVSGGTVKDWNSNNMVTYPPGIGAPADVPTR